MSDCSSGPTDCSGERGTHSCYTDSGGGAGACHCDEELLSAVDHTKAACECRDGCDSMSSPELGCPTAVNVGASSI